ncbi:MAG: twin-arginine translocation (Tat) [Bradyrhizobium sp.]
MKLGDLLKFSAGLVAGTILLAASAQAAPVSPISGHALSVPAVINVEPAVVSQSEVDQMKPVLVHWHHHHWHHHHWHHRHWHHHHWRHHR